MISPRGVTDSVQAFEACGEGSNPSGGTYRVLEMYAPIVRFTPTETSELVKHIPY